MNPNEFNRIRSSDKVLMVFGIFLAAVLAYYFAACFRDEFTFAEMLKHYEAVLEEPFRNYFNRYTIPALFGAEAIYAVAVLAYVTSRRNLMPGKEFGTMEYESPKKLNRRLANRSRDIHDPRNIAVAVPAKKTKHRKGGR